MQWSVSLHSYEDNSKFKTKAECENIPTTTCDLTVETPSDYNVEYVAQVLVNGRHYGYPTRFKPIAHSKSFHTQLT